jgi:autotransporter-associated beta strand protein
MDSHRKRIRADLLSTPRAKAAPVLTVALMSLTGSACFTGTFCSPADGATIRDETSDSLYTSLSAEPQYASPSGVIYVNAGSSTVVGSGTLVAPDWVLTAAHVVTTDSGTYPAYSAASITFGQGASEAFPAGDTGQSVAVEYGWQYSAQAGNDLALVQLSTPVTTAAPATLFSSAQGSELNQTATIVGYGKTGTGLTGDTEPAGTRRAIQNVVDAYGGQITTGIDSQTNFAGYSSNIMLTDFDQPGNPNASIMGGTTPLPLEGASVSGDSGGGLFLTVGGSTYLAGVEGFVEPTQSGVVGTYGCYNGYTRVAVSESMYFITSTLAVPCTWQSTGGGSWSSNSNWTNDTSPQFAGAAANFLGAILGNQTVTLDDSAYPWIVGAINFDNSFSYTISPGSPGGSIVLNSGTAGTSAAINDLSGTHYITAPIELVSNTAVSVNNPSDELHLSGRLTGPGSLTLAGNGSLFLESANFYNGPTAVSSGSLVLAAGDALPAGTQLSIGSSGNVILGQNIGVETLSSVSIASGGVFDVGNNHVFINYSIDPKTTILGYLATGASDGAWTGPGIDSSAAAGNRYYGVGFADGADHLAPGLTSGEIELKYALYGDILLQGNVNGSDFSILAANFGKNVTNGWETGDFNYQGKVSATDFALLASNFGKTASGTAITLPASEWAALDSFAAANGLLADLPEPSGLMLAGIGLLLLKRRRRSAR